MSEIAGLSGPRTAVRLARAALWLILTIAVLAGVGTLIAGILALGDGFAAGQIHLTLVADKAVPTSGAAWAAHVVSGSYGTAQLTLRGMSTAVAAFSIVSSVALLLTQLALCFLAATLAWRLLRGTPFQRSVSVTVTIAGGVLAIGGLLSQAGNALGGGLAASELNGGGNGFWPLAGRFDPTLMVVGFVLLLVGIAFEYGTRLQKDTEGLV